jgi:glycosyltransferase involved in cell wall biosynthesis
MRLLLLTFYYPPDLSAGSFRAKALVDALIRRCELDLQIDVVTTGPNRYHSHVASAREREQEGPVTITRIPLPTHRSGLVDQSLVFGRFARRVLASARGRQWDLVLATSSRLMTAALGAVLARRGGAKLYLDIRDLFVDTVSELFAGAPLRCFAPVLKLIEGRTFAAASRINLVSPGFREYVTTIVPSRPLSFFTNGIDKEFLTLDFSPQPVAPGVPPLIVYAGNIGEGQGLHHIVPQAAQKLAGAARFRLIGDGGRRRQLEAVLSEAGTGNVEIIDPIPRRQLCDYYREADILFLHLNDYEAFRKVLPSKIFEYAATGKRILAGVPGYAAGFLRHNVGGCAVFEPCNVNSLIDGFGRLFQVPDRVDRELFKHEFSRTHIMDAMAGDVLSLVRDEHDGHRAGRFV